LYSLFPCFREGGSEQVLIGAQISKKPPTDHVDRFLFMLRFDSREKVNALGRYVDPKVSKTGIEWFESDF
jgi:hypothetical protein